MRIKFRIDLRSNSPVVPVSYRKMVLSVIKHLIKSANSSKYSEYFEKNNIKPYTFSVYLPRPKFTGTQFELAEPRLDIIFSTINFDDIALLHNGILAVKTHQNGVITYKDMSLYIGDVQLLNEPSITNTRILCKTLAPIVIRKNGIDTSHKKEWFVRENDGIDILNQALTKTMAPLIETYLNKTTSFELVPVPGKFKETFIKVQDDESHTGTMFGFKGLFELHGDSDVLQFLYRIGVGSKRSYGLGGFQLH